MAATIAISQLMSIGSVNSAIGTGNLGTYATGGVAVTSNQFGLGNLLGVHIQPTSGYSFVYNSSTGKILAYGNGGVAAHTHDLSIIGSQAAASTAAIAYYATDIFGKEAATDKTIAGSASDTKGGVVSNSVGSSSLIIGAEVTDATDLSAVSFIWRASGA